MNLLRKGFIKILQKVISVELMTSLIVRLSSIYRIDLMPIAMQKRGFLNHQNSEISGEKYFINNFLKDLFKSECESDLVFFDVGANVGKYTAEIQSAFPKAKIYSFEPNPNSYDILVKNIKALNDSNNIKFVPFGLSSETMGMKLTTYSKSLSSSHASLNQELFKDFHHSDDNILVDANFITLDQYCTQNDISKINLLKIDTEGHELEVLKGGIKMIKEGRVDAIQFEFGECNVYSRVFLRDFYILLEGFKFYRLLPNKLLYLNQHTPAHEIFQFQNILAIR